MTGADATGDAAGEAVVAFVGAPLDLDANPHLRALQRRNDAHGTDGVALTISPGRPPSTPS